MSTSAEPGPAPRSGRQPPTGREAADARRASASSSAAAGAPDPTGDPSLSELFSHLGEEAKHLVRMQVELARVEATRTAAAVLFDAFKLGVAGAILGLAGVFGVVALMLGASVLLGSYWLGSLVTAGLLFVVGALFLWRATDTLLLPKLLPVDLLDRVREMRAFAGDPDREEAAD